MTQDVTATDEVGGVDETLDAVSEVPRLRLGEHVARQAGRLQVGYVGVGHPQNSWATGALARLRRAVTAPAGHDARVWDLVLEGLEPGRLSPQDPDAPTSAERAAHMALTLFAVHQQSQREPMHRRGIGLGTAVQRLARRSGETDDPAVVRRFQVLGTASTIEEIQHHARGLVTQLRGEAIPTDYGRLAVELQQLLDPARAGAVRLRWGRDFYGRRVGGAVTTDARPADRTPTTTEENA